MAFKTAICDDQQFWVDMLVKKLDHYNVETGIEFDISTFLNPEELLSVYNEPGRFDFLFLDMEMPVNGKDIKGIDVAKRIRSLPDNDVKIIFVSAYPEYMQMGYDVQASYYLFKNDSTEKFDSVLTKIISLIKKDTSLVKVKVDREKWDILKTKDIYYIRSLLGKRDYVEYITVDGVHSEHRPITSIGEALRSNGFAFANKHNLVNIAHIQSFTKDDIIMDNGHKIRISRRYGQSFHSQLCDYVFTYT